MIEVFFDQYQRYKKTQEIVDELRTGNTCFNILEVGANEHRNLEKFLPHDNITYMDIHLDKKLQNNPRFIIGDATQMDFKDDSYDLIVALDVFEHIPPQRRENFIHEINRVASKAFVLMGPFDTAGVAAAERNANAFFKGLTGYDHPWLIEHVTNGLPDLNTTIQYFREHGINYVNGEHDSTSIWGTLMRYHFLSVYAESILDQTNTIHKFYNEHIFPFDTEGPCYRQMIVGSKHTIASIKALKKKGGNDLEKLNLTEADFFKKLLDDTSSKTELIRAKDNHIANLEHIIENIQLKDNHIANIEALLKQKENELQTKDQQTKDIEAEKAKLHQELRESQIQQLTYKQKLEMIDNTPIGRMLKKCTIKKSAKNNYKGRYCIDNVTVHSPNHILVDGWVLCDTEYELRALLDGTQSVNIHKMTEKRTDVQQTTHYCPNAMCGFKEEIYVSDLNFKEISIQILYHGIWQNLYRQIISELRTNRNPIIRHIDRKVLRKHKIIISGWAFCKDGTIPEIKVIGNYDYKVLTMPRHDVILANKDVKIVKNQVGFELTIQRPINKEAVITYCAEGCKLEDHIKMSRLRKERRRVRIHKMLSYDGLKKIIRKLRHASPWEDYNTWIRKQIPTETVLAKQRQHRFAYEPLISIVVPTYNTPSRFLTEMIESVRQQSYQNWELCIADGHSQTPDTIKILNTYKEKDKRIKIKLLDQNLGISGNSNECLKLASGEYIALFDHDDLLTPNALHEVVSALNENRDLDFIYSDEDKTDENSKEFFEPHFKQDWAPDTFMSYNYICHFTVFRKKLLEKVGGFNAEYDGSQDYDLFLRLTECTTRIHHIPTILYHWRVHKNSTAANIGNKEYTIKAAQKALQAHLDRMQIKGTMEPGLVVGTHRAKYEIAGTPKVSIIIPNKDHITDLQKCLASVGKSTYSNYEIIIIENNSTEKETFEYYESLQKQNNIKVVTWEKEFNFSAINNYGIQSAKGEYLILLNNDIEILTPNWIEEMLMHCQRKEVGIVGAKLYYPDNTIQHAGVIVGLSSVAGHSHKYFKRDDNGYFNRLKITQNLSAVTAACLMVRKDVFDSVHGLDETFKVAFNDVDFCLKVREQNKLVIFTPYVEAYHHESKSRGAEDTPEKMNRFQGEINRFYSKWGKYKKDPYYNIHLTLDREDFGLNLN